MPDHSDDVNQNPIVALAHRLRARRDVESAIDSAVADSTPASIDDAEAGLAALGAELSVGAKRLNSVLKADPKLTFVRLDRPLRIRLRFGEKRISLDIDGARQLVIIKGLELDGEYQFDTGASVPALINLSKLSTEAGYGEALTASSLLKLIAQDAELPRPAHLDAPGPLQF